MKRLLAMLLIILFSSSIGWTQAEFSTYKAELVRKIPIGNGPGALGYSVGPGIANVPSRPVVFNNQIYIMDTDNGRLNVYDKEFKFIREIHFNDSAVGLTHAYYFDILPDGGIIGISSIAAIRVTKDGNITYLIQAEKLPEYVWNGGRYWLFKDNLLFTAREDGGDIIAIDGKGHFLSPTEIVQLGEEMKSGSILRKESSKLQVAIDKFLKDNKLMLAGDRDLLLTWNAELCNQFYQVIRENSGKITRNRVRDAEYTLSRAAVGNADSEGNRHWYLTNIKSQKRLRYIISPRGEVLDFFNITPEGRQREDSTELVFVYAFASDGTLYSLVQNSRDNSYDAYRVSHHW